MVDAGERRPRAADRQRLGAERLGMAAAASAVAVLIVGMVAFAGLLPGSAAGTFAMLVALCVIVFTALVRSGANLRFADPSLAVPMLVAAGIAITYVVFLSHEARPALASIYLIAFLFATFTQGVRRLLLVALFYAGCYAAVLGLHWLRGTEGMAWTRELFRFAVFAVLLAWLAVFGVYVSRLRRALHDRNEELRRSLERIEHIAMRDELTGVHNRRALLETLTRELARARRTGERLCLVAFDIDFFKSVNDTWGHAAGDAVLKRFAEIVRAALRGGDVAARIGGEEFVIMLPGTELAGATLCAERIRVGVESERFAAVSETHRITVSGGIARARRDETALELLARADAALYAAKRAGRNRTLAVD